MNSFFKRLAVLAHSIVCCAIASNGVCAADEQEALFATPTTRDRIGRIVAPVYVNGQGPFNFVVDTGANTSVLSIATANGLRLVPSEEHAVDVYGVTGNSRLPTVDVSQLQAGVLSLQNLRLPVAQSVMGGADGLLGVEGFAGLKLSVDFEANRIEISKPRRGGPLRGYMIVPVQLVHGRLLVIDAAVGRVKVKAVIDTGAERTLGNEALLRALAKRRGVSYTTREAAIEGITAVTQTGKAMLSPTIRLGATQITDVEVVFGKFAVFDLWELSDDPALLIGMDVLGVVRRLNIDYQRKQLQMMPR